MGKLYDAFDSFIMKSVNEGVRAWNWTTGRTKSDLANICNVGGTVSISAGAFHMHNPVIYALIPLSIIGGLITPGINRDTETREIKALERGLKDPVVEKRNQSAKFYSGLSGVIGALLTPYALEGKETSFYLCIGNFLHSAENYAMRAENFPRKKNVFSRALDNLRESIAEYGVQRQPITIKLLEPLQID